MPETVVHFQIRMPPELHEKLSSRARQDKTSLNALVVNILLADEARVQAAESSNPQEPKTRG